MPFQMVRVLCAAGVLGGLALEASVIDVTSRIGARLPAGSVTIYESSKRDDLRVEDSFSRHIEYPPGSLDDHFFGASVEIDAERGVFRGKSNLFTPGFGFVEWQGRVHALEPLFGRPGKVVIPVTLTVRSNFSYDRPQPPGAVTTAHFEASLRTDQFAGEVSSFVYNYYEAADREPILSTTPTGDVVIIESSRGYIEVVLRTAIEYECCSVPINIIANLDTRLYANGGTGGAINAFDSAFLTLSLPPGYTRDPGSRFLSIPFEQPQAIPEPWMTPLLGLFLTSLAIWKRQTRARLGRP